MHNSQVVPGQFLLLRIGIGVQAQLRTNKLPLLVASRSIANVPGVPGLPGPPTPGQESTDDTLKDGNASGKKKSNYKESTSRIFESVASTFAGLSVLALAGYGYHKYYKSLVLRKIEIAFQPGDPVLELAERDGQLPDAITEQYDHQHWIHRAEQTKIDAIIDGTDRGHYHLLLGPKGTGKSSMILEAMRKIEGEGVSMFEAHADLEVMRIRLGKALNYEYHEDYIGSLFSIKGPRDTTALLDIERAFNKLEKVALNRRKKIGKPCVLVINSCHLLRDDEDGRDFLELIQQRAEQWAASNLVTIVLNSDDHWVYHRLKQLGTRLSVLPVADLSRTQAMEALSSYRRRYWATSIQPPDALLAQVYAKVGGRITFLSRVAKAPDMLEECEAICRREKQWFLDHVWILGEEMDDDVMDQQKYCAAAMTLAKALVDLDRASAGDDPVLPEPSIFTYTPRPDPLDNSHIMPEIPLHIAQQVMTRADFTQTFDRLNFFTIDPRSMVRADSVPMMNAFREICSTEGFAEHLEATMDRIAAIESLGRTRELVAKDLGAGGKFYEIMKHGSGLKVMVKDKDKEAD